MLQLFCLGSPQIKLSPTAFQPTLTPKALALFVYLSVTQQAHRRDTLADLLWSETNNKQARTNLRYLLPEVRRQLDDYLVITPQTIAFQRQSPYWLDVELLRTTLAVSPVTLTTPALQAALDLYQGEFLAGFTVRNAPVFEEWVTSQREELHTSVVQGLYALAERYLEQENMAAGLATTQRLLFLEPWHEAGHRLQMQFLAATGQRGAAIEQYHQLRQRLADELGVDLTEVTRDLYLQIIHGKLPVGKVGVLSDRPLLVANAPSSGVAANAAADRSARTPSHNLPLQLTPFIGRQQEVADLSAKVLASDSQLITLVGEGGIGKTRLALAVAQAILDFGFWILDSGPEYTEKPKSESQNCSTIRLSSPKSAAHERPKFPDGLWFVSLSGITGEGDLTELLAVAVAQAIGLQFIGHRPLLTQLLTYLRDKALLLLFDNAEHLLPAVADFLIELLQGSRQTTILVTSRHILNLQAEFVWRVTGLPVPPHPDLTTLAPADLTGYSSILLFVERASRFNRNFQLTAANGAAVAAICRLVEGLPLAIELAAALTKQYSCRELYTALQRDYTILATTFVDLSPRHRSIQAMLDYSWRFLHADEARTLAACSLFFGGFTRSAAMAVAGATPALLTKFVDHSLLQVHEGRFLMHELVRHYAAAQLDQFPEERHAGLAHHAAYYMALLHGSEATLLTAFDAQSALQNELDNVRTAWLWSAAQHNLDLLAMGVESLQSFYRLAGLHREAIYLLEMALAAVRQRLAASVDLADPVARPARQLLARLLCHIAQFYRRAGGVETGERLAQEALTVGQQVNAPALQGLAYHELARLAQVRSDFPTMYTLAEQGCTQARRAGLPQLTAECLNDLGIAVSSCMHPRFAIPHFHEALHGLRDGTNRYLEARVLGNLGFFYLSCHEYQLAYRYLPQTLALQHLLQDREGSMITQIFLGDLWMAIGAYDQAQQEYEQALTTVQTIHNPYWKSWLHISYAHLQYLRGDLTAAHNACTSAQQIVQQGKSHVQTQWILIDLGYILTDQGDWQAARHCYEQAIALQAGVDWSYRTADAHAGLAALLLAQGEIAAALVHVEAALTDLKQKGIAVAKEPFRIYLACVRVLQAAGDPRAVDVLRTAAQLLQVIADPLEDAALRQAFLEKVVVNRHLRAAAQAAGVI